MQPFNAHTGMVMPLDRVNVDTDQMVPKQFLKALTREGFGRILFYDWRYLPGEKPNPEFVMNFPRYKGASVLLARANFGCGSSREHAPWGVKDYGFRVVVAPSYADIFYNNCFKNGILPATLPEEQIEELFQRTEKEEGYSLTVNLPNQTIADKHGLMFKFEIAPSRKEGARRHRHHVAARTGYHRLRESARCHCHYVRGRRREVLHQRPLTLDSAVGTISDLSLMFSRRVSRVPDPIPPSPAAGPTEWKSGCDCPSPQRSLEPSCLPQSESAQVAA
jgi:3-isopropylmalate/(R)-2-methylmalate dehydratase small subunit